MALSQPSFSSFANGFTYDVFLSFRGCDTRHHFTGNLWKALCDKGICTFFDDKELRKGEEITPALEKAIENSRIAIIVLSEDYASSSFCLDELSKILDCIKGKGRLVWPVFYKVDPSDVRKQTGTYGEAMAMQEKRFKDNMDRLQKWKNALHQVANLVGSHFILRNEYEHEFIWKIVKEVSDKINRQPLHVARYPVGLEPRVQQVLSLLDVASDNVVHMVGIYGIGGMGKTTLARAVYNYIADMFEGLCFLNDVRKHGLVDLQKTLLYDIVGEKDIQIGSFSEGIPIIERRLKGKKILLILDDVDNMKQLWAIAGKLTWFGPGSRVIITTRDKHLLTTHGIKKTYEVDGLNEKEACELLSWNAFKNDEVDPSYKNVINQVVAYTSGLPLALEVIGCNLFGRDTKKWESALHSYEKIPIKEIQEVLKVSFDALEEEEQSVFLDIACCLKGYRLAEVKEILHANHGSGMEYQIEVLIDKSLIKIIDCDKVTLHDLIEDMGKKIASQKSPKEPGKRTRLWDHKDIVKVLKENKGTNEIEIIYLNGSLLNEEKEEEDEVDWDGEAFKNMTNLKTLIIKNIRFSKGPKHFPKSLRVLEWWGYPSHHLPPNRLSICKLPYSHCTCMFGSALQNHLKAGWMQKIQWITFFLMCIDVFVTRFQKYAMSWGLLGSPKKLVNMTVLNLDNCEYLTEICDMSSLPNLKKLSFQECKNLITIHDSVGYLEKLEILKASGCHKLRSFPPFNLPSLKDFDFIYCESLKSFPKITGKMEKITKLRFQGINMKELPHLFRNLTRLQNLQDLEMIYCKMFQSGKSELFPKQDGGEQKVSSMSLSKVEHLTLRGCNMSNEFLAIGLMWFVNLKELILRYDHNFTIVPECIKECRFLWKFHLSECDQLQKIKGIPPSLKYFSAHGCNSLTSECRSMFLKQELHELGNTSFVLPGRASIPEWFEHQSRGQSTSFWFRNKFPDIVLCLVCPDPQIYLHSRLAVIINDKKFFYMDLDCADYIFLSAIAGHTHLLHLLRENFIHNLDEALLENQWNHAKVTIESHEVIFRYGVEYGVILEMLNSIDIGIHVLKEKSVMEDIRFTNPYEKPQFPENDVEDLTISLSKIQF